MSSPGYSYGHPSALSWAAQPSYNLTALSRGLWGYYKFDELPGGGVRADSSGRGNALSFPDVEFTRDEGNSTPFAAVLSGGMAAETPAKPLDGLMDQWGFTVGLRLTGSPAADAEVLMHGSGTNYRCGLRVLWNGEDLCFRMQTGYRAEHEGEAGYEYRNDIIIPDPTLNAWFFVAGSFRGPSFGASQPVTETLMTLRVNDTMNSVAAMALDSVNPPVHTRLSEVWTIGTSFVGRIGPLSIYERAPSDGEMSSLYNDGDWLVLPL